MKEFNVSVKTDMFTVRATLNHKINVIQGPSGCGKTYTLNKLQDKLPDSNNIVIPTIALLVNDDYLQTLNTNTIIWCDEGVTGIAKKLNLLSRLNKYNFRCVFVSRDVLTGITYSYKAVYKMDFDSIKHEYILNSYYPDYDTKCEGKSFVTEDTKSGYYYYNQYLSNVKYPQKHEDIIVLAKNNNSTLIADGLAFGFRIKKALEDKINLFLPESFEYLIGSKLFSKEKMFGYDVQDMITHNHTTEEKCVTRHFIEECRKLNPPINYDKTIESIKDTIIMKTNVFDRSHEEVLREYYKTHNLEFETQVKRDAESFGEHSCQIHNIALNDVIERAYQANKLLGNI